MPDKLENATLRVIFLGLRFWPKVIFWVYERRRELFWVAEENRGILFWVADKGIFWYAKKCSDFFWVDKF